MGQTGPGGVGNSTTNSLWLRANDINQADNSTVSSWSDFSGNSNDASQGNACYQPIYKPAQVNGMGTVRFDGVNDFFDDVRSYDARTIFSVYNVISTIQQSSDLGQIWGSYNQGFHLALDARSGGGTWSFDGNGSNQGRFGLFGAAFNSFNANPNSPSWSYDQYEMVSLEFNATRSLSRQVIGSLVPSFSVGVHQFGGDIAEVIVYNTVLNSAQRIIVENYLAAKYNLSVVNDFYSYKFTHGFELAGIGRHSLGNEHSVATSSNLIRIENPSALDDAEYLFFGHNNASISSWIATESPDNGVNISHLAREWRMNETGDVGLVDFVIDIQDLPAQPAGHNMYAIMIDDDGDFSSGASIYQLILESGTEYSVEGLSVTNGQYISIASMRGVVEHGEASSFGSETADADIEVRLNYIPQNNVTFEITTADGTATVADYTPQIGQLVTFTAPASTVTYTISIANDVIIESDENFSITLSNPSFGVIGTNSVHTYTIIDDDNPRKIYFDLASSSGLESVTSGNLAVSINLVDNTNPTTVDYVVTGGTATGGGVDYTLAAGTLTIPSGSTSENITFTVVDDNIHELDETFTVTLSNPTNCNLDVALPASGTGFISHTYTILDDEPTPEIQFTSSGSSGSESVSPITINIELSAESEANISVDFTLSGTATGGGVDYFLENGTITIPAGDLTASLSLIIIDDIIEELSETVIITLSNPTVANLGTNTTYTYTIIDNDNVGALGPGGVGLSSNIMLLLQADDIDQADESFVSTWNDLSGNNHHAIQATATNQPTLRTGVVNGHNAVRFDGNNDFFNNAYSYDGRTVFVVYRMLAATQNTSQLPQFWGSYSEAIHVAPDPRSGGGRWSFDGGGNTTARHSINGAAYSSFATNPAGPSWTSDVFQMVKVEFDATIAISTQAIGSLINPSPHFLGGEIVEMSVFNITLNSVQSLMIENHLSAKYNIGINNDIYSFDAPGNFEHDVAGIGRIDINNFHLDARGNSVLRIYNPSDLDDNEFLIWGHNNLILAAEDTSDVPAGIDGRWRRVWRVNEVDASGNSVDVGSVDIEFDLSGTGNVDAADLALLIDVNNNGLFNDETAIFGAIDAGSGVYRFENVSGLANNLRFTLASADTS